MNSESIDRTENGAARTRVFQASFVFLALLMAGLVFSFSLEPVKAERMGTFLSARLTGDPIGGVTPHGIGFFVVDNLGNGYFETDVLTVNLPSGTMLDVTVDGVPAGQIRLNSFHSGSLRISSSNGVLPAVQAGSILDVNNGGATILSGTFAGLPTPSPTATATSSPTPRPSRFFGGVMDGQQVVPPVTTNGRGVVNIVLNTAETQVTVYMAFVHLSSDQTTAGIYGPALRGQTGDLIFDMGTVGGVNGYFPHMTFDVTPQQVDQLRMGLWYAQIGSVNNPGGEIRGQIRSLTRSSAYNGGAVGDERPVFLPQERGWYDPTAD